MLGSSFPAPAPTSVMLKLVSVVESRLGHVLAMVWLRQDRAEPWIGLSSPD